MAGFCKARKNEPMILAAKLKLILMPISVATSLRLGTRLLSTFSNGKMSKVLINVVSPHSKNRAITDNTIMAVETSSLAKMVSLRAMASASLFRNPLLSPISKLSIHVMTELSVSHKPYSYIVRQFKATGTRSSCTTRLHPLITKDAAMFLTSNCDHLSLLLNFA